MDNLLRGLRPGGAPRERGARLLLLLLSLTAVVTVTEFVAGRVTRWPVQNAVDWDGKDPDDIPYNRGISQSHAGRGPAGKYAWTAKINSRGFRDREYQAAKPPGVFRIIAVGDSNTYGLGVNLEDTYPKQLEELLAKNARGQVEVLNFGAAGAGTAEELALIEKKALSYSPDLLLLQAEPNDTESIAAIRDTAAWLNLAILALKKIDLDSARLLKVLLERYKYSYYIRFVTQEEEFEAVARPLKEIVRLCRERGLPLAIVKYDPGYTKESYERALRAAAAEGAPVLDLSASRFGNLPPMARYLDGRPDPRSGRPRDGHATPYANKLIAGDIADFLRSSPGLTGKLRARL